MDNVAHLYKITNTVTGEYYIGKHNGWTQNGYWGSGNRIQRLIKKYGTNNFKYDILIIADVNYIFELERKMVTVNLIESDKKCLNLVGGGYGSSGHTQEHKQKLSETLKQVLSCPIIREKISTGVKKTYENPKIRQKNRIATLKNRLENPEKWKDISKRAGLTKRGIIFSEEHKQKLSDAGKGKIPWNKGKTNTISEDGLKSLREKSGKSTSNTTWMNDGVNSYRIKKENVISSKEKGLIEGRLRDYINNEYIEKLKKTTTDLWQKAKKSGNKTLKVS